MYNLQILKNYGVGNNSIHTNNFPNDYAGPVDCHQAFIQAVKER
jgi:hypothetical protein